MKREIYSLDEQVRRDRNCTVPLWKLYHKEAEFSERSSFLPGMGESSLVLRRHKGDGGRRREAWSGGR